MSFTRAKKRTGSSSTSSSKPKPNGDIKLWDYQKQAVEFGVEREGAGFFLAPGLGKTLISLMIFKILKAAGVVDEMMVVAKRRIVYNVWRQEVTKWKFPFKTVILHGDEKTERLSAKTDIWLINYDGLQWLKNQKMWLRRAKKRRIMLVCDESSKLRHTKTQRFKSLKKILPRFVRRYILTGSPAPSGLMGLFGQIYVLDYGEALGRFITAFRNEYFYPSGFMGYKWTLQKGAEEQMFKDIKHLVIRFGTDKLKLPPLTMLYRYVTLPPKAREQYDRLERDFILEYEEGNIIASNAAVASGKLRQVANGGCYYSPTGVPIDEVPGKKPPRKWRTIHDEKCDELVELLEELNGEPALVAFEFKHDVERIRAFFKENAPQFKDAPVADGKTSDEELEKLLVRWNEGAIPVLFGHPESVAHGLNLQGKGGIVIFFTMTWNLENYEQFIQRVWRQGQKRRVLVYHIIARDTVDEDVKSTIESKDRSQQRLLKAMERRYGIRQEKS